VITLTITPASQVPPYEQLRRQLIDQIMSRTLPVDTKLPAVRRLAADLGIAPGTVARAYKELEAEGYLVTRGRNGTLVAPIAAVDEASQVKGSRLAEEYVSAMQSLGFATDAILGEVRRALG